MKDPQGTALIIPPKPKDYKSGSKKHWIICLFTSRGFGRQVSPPDLIVNSTHSALEDLKNQLERRDRLHRESGWEKPGKLFSCRFNSGLFGVPWERTRKLLDDAGLDVAVVYPLSEDEEVKKQ